MRGAAVLFPMLVCASAPLAAQDGVVPRVKPSEAKPAEVPFGIGERLRYRVKFGPLEVGEAEMEVVGVDTVAGHATYHVRFSVRGETFFYKLEDVQESWLDVYCLASRRFRQDVHQGDYERLRQYEFDLEERLYRRSDGDTGAIPPDALDDASFVYFVRTVPLEIGKTYEWNRYYRLDRNPVILKVLRRETVEVPAGEFGTIVVRPIIKTRGIYSEGGEAEIFVTDDERRIPVKLKSRFNLGSLTLDLTDYRPGEPLTAGMLGLR